MKSRTRFFRLSAVAAWLGFLAPLHPFAQSISIIAEDDITIRHNSTVQSSDGDLALKRDSSQGSSSNRQGWMKFDLSGQSVDPESSATFAITYHLPGGAIGGDMTFEAFALDAGYTPTAATDWLEATADGASNTPPGYVDGYNISGFTSLGTQTLHADNDLGVTLVYNIDELGDYLQADGTVTIALLANTNSGPPVMFYSSEDFDLEPLLTFYPANLVTKIAADDVTVRHYSGNQNEDGNLLIKHDTSAGSSSNRQAWLKFDLSGQIPNYQNGAEFSVTYAGSSYAGTLDIEAHALNYDISLSDTDWDEAVIDGNGNMPPGYVHGHAISGFTSLGVQSIHGTNDTGLTLTYNIDQLDDFVQYDNTLTIAILCNTVTSAVLAFSSSEAVGLEPTLEYEVAQAATIFPSDDVFVKHGGSNQNENGALVVKRDTSTGSTSNRTAWLKFDLSEYSVDLLSGGTFTINYNQPGGPIGGNMTFEAWALDSGYTPSTDTNWDEAVIDGNSNTPPGYGGGHAVTSSTLIGSQTIHADNDTGAVLSFEIDQLGGVVQADQTMTIAVISKTTNSQPVMFFSSENAGFEPTLTFMESEADSDNDSLPDYWEVVHFGTLDHDGDDDVDGDGLTNSEELALGSQPNNPLSNEDDVDADGLPDAWEVQHFGSIQYSGGDDFDGDNATNAMELEGGTDPTDPNSYPIAPAELHTLWDAVEALATDVTYTGRISTQPLVDWQSATDTTGTVSFNNYHGHPKTNANGTETTPIIFRDIDFGDRTLWLSHSNLVFENCVFDASRYENQNPGSSWVRPAEDIANITFRNCEFVGKKGGDNINGGINPSGNTSAVDYPNNYTRPHGFVVERCRFKWTTGDYMKPSFGPGTVFRHNHFGYAWMFDPEVIQWNSTTGGVGILAGDKVIYRNAQSIALVDYPTTTPPDDQGDPDTAEWDNLGDIPHNDYLQDGDGGPTLWEGNLFEVGTMDHLGLVNNVVRFARDFGTHRAIASHAFVGNVFRLRENYDGPLYPIIINHKATDGLTLEDVNVIGPMEFSYNLLIPQKNYPTSALSLSGGAAGNLIFHENYFAHNRLFIAAPGAATTTTSTPVPTPPQVVPVAAAPEILYEARLLSQDHGDGSISYRIIAPIYDGRADSVTVAATLNGTEITGFDADALHTYTDTDEFIVTYTISNASGSVTSTVGQNNQLTHIPYTGAMRYAVTDRTWPDQAGEADICMWRDDKLGAISLTIDDNQSGQIDWWLQKGSETGYEFTWFIITDWVGNSGIGGEWTDWAGVVAAGHDVQSHTYKHLSDMANQTIDDEYRIASEMIATNIPGYEAKTLAYPGGGNSHHNDATVATNYYVAARGTSAVINDPRRLNFMSLNSNSGTIPYGGTSWNDLGHIQNPSDNLYRGWLIAHYHQISATDKTNIENAFAYIDSQGDDFWVGSFTDVALYASERENAQVSTTMVDEDTIRITLTDLMDDSIYDEPLSVKVRLPENWTGATATQNGSSVGVAVITHNGADYALVDVVPDTGHAILSN